MSEEINKSVGDGSDEKEIDIFVIDDLYDKKYTTEIKRNATVEDLVKQVQGWKLQCFNSKDKKYFILRRGGKIITTSESIKKTMAGLDINQGDAVHVGVYDKVPDNNKDGFLEIKKLEIKKESKHNSEVTDKKIEEITVYVQDLNGKKVELKLKTCATFEELLIALEKAIKADGSPLMRIAQYFKLFSGTENLSNKLEGKNLQQVKISDLGIKKNFMLTFAVCVNKGENMFSWTNIKDVDEKNLTDKTNPKKIMDKIETKKENTENQVIHADTNEISKTEKESKHTSEVTDKKIEEITVRVRDTNCENVELKLKPDAAFEDLLIALKKVNRTSVMKSAEYFKLIFGGKDLKANLKDKDLKQVKINDKNLGIEDGFTLTFMVPISSSKDTAFSWADIKDVDEKGLTGESNSKKIIIKTSGEQKSVKSVNVNIDNLRLETQTSTFSEQENKEKTKSPLVNINKNKILENNMSNKKLEELAVPPEVTEESKSKESLASRIIREIKSFFSWLYEIFFGKCNPQIKTINNSQILIENNIQQRIGSVPCVRTHGKIEENPININKTDRD